MTSDGAYVSIYSYARGRSVLDLRGSEGSKEIDETGVLAGDSDYAVNVGCSALNDGQRAKYDLVLELFPDSP